MTEEMLLLSACDQYEFLFTSYELGLITINMTTIKIILVMGVKELFSKF